METCEGTTFAEDIIKILIESVFGSASDLPDQHIDLTTDFELLLHPSNNDLIDETLQMEEVSSDSSCEVTLKETIVPHVEANTINITKIEKKSDDEKSRWFENTKETLSYNYSVFKDTGGPSELANFKVFKTSITIQRH